MRKSHFTITLISFWLVSFLFCLLVPIFRKQSLPDNFGNMIKEAFDTFSPTLATMLAFIYARNQPGNSSSRRMRLKHTDILALILSVVYLMIFNIIMFLFLIRHSDAVETIESFQQFRPYLAFLVTGMIAYYFGTQEDVSEGGN